MFHELYSRVSARVDELRECQAKLRKIPQNKLREQGKEPIARVQAVLNELGEPEEAQLACIVPKFSQVVSWAVNLLQRLRMSRFADMVYCDCENCHASREDACNVVPIDRPDMPEPPLRIPGRTLVDYLRKLATWIAEAYEDLSIDDKLTLPPVGDRYAIADVGQLAHVSECLKRGDKLRLHWSKLTNEHGARWDSSEIGLTRLSVIMAAVKVLTDMVTPPDEDCCSLGKTIGQIIDENGLASGPGGFLLGNFGPGPGDPG